MPSTQSLSNRSLASESAATILRSNVAEPMPDTVGGLRKWPESGRARYPTGYVRKFNFEFTRSPQHWLTKEYPCRDAHYNSDSLVVSVEDILGLLHLSVQLY